MFFNCCASNSLRLRGHIPPENPLKRGKQLTIQYHSSSLDVFIQVCVNPPHFEHSKISLIDDYTFSLLINYEIAVRFKFSTFPFSLFSL